MLPACVKTLHHMSRCVTYDVMFSAAHIIPIVWLWPVTTRTSKHSYFIHSSHSTDSSTQNYAIYTTQIRNARHNATGGQNRIVTACHSTDAHIHDSNGCYSLRVLLLRVCSETGEFWTTLKLHCAMPISGIAVVSSIAIHETVSLSSLQFQVSHNTSCDVVYVPNFSEIEQSAFRGKF